MAGLSFADGNGQQGAPPSDPVGCLYRDVLTTDGHGSAESSPTDRQSGGSPPEQAFNPQPQQRVVSLPASSASDVAPPPPPASRLIRIDQPIKSLCGAAGAGPEGPLAVSGPIQTVSDQEILANRESEEEIRKIPRFQSYRAGVPSRVGPVCRLLRRCRW